MRSIIYAVVMVLIGVGYSCRARSQGINADSLQKTISEFVKRQTGQKYLPKSFMDSSKIFSSFSPIDLKKLMEGLNKDISDAKSAGDMGRVTKGYGKLSSLDSTRGNFKGAYENYKLYTVYRDSLQKKELEQKELQARMQREFEKKQAQQQVEKEKENRKNVIRQILLLATLIGFIIVATTLFIAYKREQKGKQLLNIRNREVETTLSELRATQAQLIQAEKMASLGELTAGIAHEIQNPLNFVNNFSEVNNELIEEVRTKQFEVSSEEWGDLLKDIFENNEKITHHGKRADAIVKSMLQHSRPSSGQKEPTEINALCDEYVRLAYHGLRAKDKSFNAQFDIDLDPSVPKLNVVPQDIGRVLLNLINNAFYAVGERQTTEGVGLQADANVPARQAGRPLVQPGYEPLVSVRTKRLAGIVEITVEDNGHGIPQEIVEKIFQPFFTTKPTGQGTGLGLSLAYDIVKAHGGDIAVKSMEDKGSEFVIKLPFQ